MDEGARRQVRGWARDPALQALPARARWRALEERLASSDDETMWEAVHLLSELRGDRARQRLLSLALVGPEARQAYVVNRALDGGADAKEVLMAVYRAPSTSDEVRDLAIDELGSCLGYQRRTSFFDAAFSTLVSALDDPCAEVRWTACFQLAQSRTRRAEEPLRRAMQDPTTSRFGAIAEIAAVGLRHLRSPRRHPLVAGYMRD